MADQTYTEAELKKMKLPELRLIAEGYEGINIKQKKADLIESILAQVEEEDDELEDDELEDDELEDDEEELEEDELEDEDDELEDDDEVDDEEEDELDDDEELDDEDLELPEEDEELDDEPEPETKKKTKAKAPEVKKPEPAGDTYTAKQVATRIGTDAKVLRKFLRSPESTIEAVGQGGRYEFAKADLPLLKEEFDKWNTVRPKRTSTPKVAGAIEEPRRKAEEADLPEEELEIDDELFEDVELDDDEFDDEEDD